MAMLDDFFPVSMMTPSNPFAPDTKVPWLALSPWLSQAPAWPAAAGDAGGVTPADIDDPNSPYNQGLLSPATPAGAMGTVPALSAPIDVSRPPGMLAPGAVDPSALPAASTPTSGPAPFSLSGGAPAAPAMAIPENQGIPKGSLLDRVVTGIADNSDMLLGLASGLVGAPNIATGFQRGFKNALAASPGDDKRRAQNQTAAWLRGKGYSKADAAAIAGNPAVLQALLTQTFGKGATADIQEYEYAKKQGYTGSLLDWTAAKRAGAGEYGLQAIYGTKDGKPAVMQLGKSGEAIQSKLPEGFEIAQKPIEVDTKTGTVLIDPQTRQQIGFIPKQIAEAAAQEKVGEVQGAARAALPAAEATTSRALRMLDEIEKHPGFGDAIGFVVGRLPALTPRAADVRERIDQLDAMVFGDAVEVMRGLGALTEREGPKITAARARLNTAKSEDDYRKALKDVREVFQIGIENMRKKAGEAAAPSAGGPTAAPSPAATAPTAPLSDPLGIR